MVIFSLVKISCFHVKAHLVFDECLLSKACHVIRTDLCMHCVHTSHLISYTSLFMPHTLHFILIAFRIITLVVSLWRVKLGLLDKGLQIALTVHWLQYFTLFFRFTKPEKLVSLVHQYQKRTLAYLEGPNQLFLMYTAILKIFNLILIMEKILYRLKWQWRK